MERSVILTSGSTLAIRLPEKRGNGTIDAAATVGDYKERERIVRTLRETKGRVSGPQGAAHRLGLKRSTLRDRMKRLGIDPRELRSNPM